MPRLALIPTLQQLPTQCCWQVADLLSRSDPSQNGAGPEPELAPVLYVSGEESVEQVWYPDAFVYSHPAFMCWHLS